MDNNKANFFIDRRVKIVTTIGPATSSYENLEKLFLAGANIFRMNFSHGSHDEHKEVYNNIRKVEQVHGKPIATLADMQGPKLRVGKFKNDKEVLEVGQTFTLDMKDELGDNTRVTLPHKQIFESLEVGSELLVDDGKVRLRVTKFTDTSADTTVVVGGDISNSKGVNFPSKLLKLSALTEKDLKDLDFALSLGVDFIALSFVQLPEDVAKAKEIIKGRAKVISKIEKPVAVQNIQGIIDQSDGIMVARGDLGVEMPAEEVPIIQKKILKLCRQSGKPVIVATQMLDSMMNSPIPTRAEASDVANAVFDGADAVMLSGETTVGKYPFITVETMSRIIKKTEGSADYWERLKNDHPKSNFPLSISEATSGSVNYIANSINAKYIVAFTTHGTTVNRICRERVKAQCLALTSSSQVYHQLSLNWGVNPVLTKDIKVFPEIVDIAKDYLEKNKFVEKGDKIIFVAGTPVGVHGLTNSIRIIEIE